MICSIFIMILSMMMFTGTGLILDISQVQMEGICDAQCIDSKSISCSCAIFPCTYECLSITMIYTLHNQTRIGKEIRSPHVYTCGREKTYCYYISDTVSTHRPIFYAYIGIILGMAWILFLTLINICIEVYISHIQNDGIYT